MKDKEIQIKEMKNNARIYIGAVVEKLRMDSCELYEIDGIVENILNYITIPEDSVVLSREEYERLQVELKSLKYTDMFKEAYISQLKDELKQASKETAEKILKKIKQTAIPIGVTKYSHIKLLETSEDELNAIAKQFGVEIKE